MVIFALEKDLGAEKDWSLWNKDLGFTPWTTADYHRSFWEISTGFNSNVSGGSNNQLVNQSWNAYTTSLTTEATSLYTLPNTHQSLTGYQNCDKNTEQSEFTKFLAKTVLVYNKGTEAPPTGSRQSSVPMRISTISVRRLCARRLLRSIRSTIQSLQMRAVKKPTLRWLPLTSPSQQHQQEQVYLRITRWCLV